MYNMENPCAGWGHAGLLWGYPARNKQKGCMCCDMGGNAHLKWLKCGPSEKCTYSVVIIMVVPLLAHQKSAYRTYSKRGTIPACQRSSHIIGVNKGRYLFWPPSEVHTGGSEINGRYNSKVS